MTPPRREPTPEILDAMRELPDAEVARRFGVSRATVQRWRHTYGIPNPYNERLRGIPAFPPPPPPGPQPGSVPLAVSLPPPRGEREVESAVLLMSDLHYGKRTRSFDRAVLVSRLQALVPRLARLHELLTHAYVLDELVVCILGDVNDGSEIYPSQPHHQDVTDPLRQAWELADVLAGWLLAVQRTWGRVRVECVAGNHGRSGRRVAESASWDVAAYHYLALRLSGSGIPVHYAQEGLDPFLRVVTVRGHRYVLYHGHGVRMYQSIPWYGLAQRVLRWRAVLGEFAALCCGHFHTYGEMEIAGTRVLLTGTPVTDDDWVLQALGGRNSNRWHLFGVGDSRPITWQFALDLV